MKRFLRFRLLTLLGAMAVVSLALAWWMRPKLVTAEASFIVRYQPPLNLNVNAEAPAPTDQQIAILQATNVERMLSFTVVQSALNNPKVFDNPLLVNADFPGQWIVKHLEVEFVDNSEVLRVSVRGPVQHARELRDIIDVVCMAFLDEVVNKHRLDIAKTLESLEHSAQAQRTKLTTKLQEIERAQRAGVDAVTLQMLEQDRQELSAVSQEMAQRIDRVKSVLQEPAPVQLIEPAHIVYD